MGITRATAECTVGGEALTIHPLTVKNIEEINNWMRVRFLRSVRESANGDQDVIALGMQEMLKLSFFSRVGQRCLTSLDGIAKVLAVSADLNYEYAMDLIRVDFNMDSFNTAFRLLNGSSEDNEDTSADPTKATAT